ncbi:MAG: tetratricopeptide repeat protein [Helicobacteraceae bacterium]|nr:tetratricopeptide repeat protein [Helicobacteraceae bacterium]
MASVIIGFDEYSKAVYGDLSDTRSWGGGNVIDCQYRGLNTRQCYDRAANEAANTVVGNQSRKCNVGENYAVCYYKYSDESSPRLATAGIIYSKDENKYYIFDGGVKTTVDSRGNKFYNPYYIGIRGKAVEYFRARLPKSYVVSSKGRALFDAAVGDKGELQLEEVEKGRFVIRGANDPGYSEYNSSLEAYNYALALYDEGNAQGAVVYFGKAINGDPKFAKAYGGRGLAYHDLGDAAKALADYTQAIKIDPNYAVAYYNRGSAYNSLGDNAKALADYTQAIKIDPNLAEAYNARGLAYRSGYSDSKEKAIADFTRAIEINPKYAETYINRGDAYASLSRNSVDHEKGEEYADKAIADYTQAIKINPKDAKLYYYRAYAYLLAPRESYTREDGLSYRRLARKDANKAIADFTHAIKLDRQDVAAIAARGTVYSDIEEYGKAIADFTQVIKIDPKSPDTYCDHAWAYKGQQNWKQAAKDARFAVELDSEQRCKTFDWLKREGKVRD